MRIKLSRLLFLPLAAMLSLAALAFPCRAAEVPWAGLTYIITGFGDHPIVYDGTGDAPDLTGYPLLLMENGARRDLGTAARMSVVLCHEGSSETRKTKLEMISALLRSRGVRPSPLESVLVEYSMGEIKLTVASDLIYYDRVTEETPYQTIRRENPALKPGEEQVVQVGAIGEKGGVYEVVWSNGAELSRQLVEELDSEPVDEIVEYGPKQAASKPASAPAAPEQGVSGQAAPEQAAFVNRDDADGGTLDLPSGEALRFTKAISMTATAYTAGHGGVGSHTASGTPVRRGVVAVDPKVIPIGAKLYISANGGYIYGLAVAEDTGVRGNRIDLYLETYQECVAFGRRNCMVYILEE